MNRRRVEIITVLFPKGKNVDKPTLYIKHKTLHVSQYIYFFNKIVLGNWFVGLTFDFDISICHEI